MEEAKQVRITECRAFFFWLLGLSSLASQRGDIGAEIRTMIHQGLKGECCRQREQEVWMARLNNVMSRPT